MRVLETTVRASEGIAVGRAFVVDRCTASTSYEKGAPEVEQNRFEQALQQSREQIETLAADSEIFAAHLEIVDDPMLSDAVVAHIDEGDSAHDAVLQASAELVAMFEAIDDEYLAARAADVKDIFARIAANLTGGVKNPFEGVAEGDIVVDAELLPSDMALLAFNKIRGFVTAEGSATSHVCIIARTLSVPAVVGLKGILSEVKSGATIIVDGSGGRVVIAPDIATLDEYKVRELNHKALLAEQQQAAGAEIFHNGERVYVFANAGSVEDVERAIAAGADGIGLFRSEFLYMQSSVEPSEQQQYEAYLSAARSCKGKPLTIRTLDIGGDKAVPYLGFEREENPFLGWRAIRVCLELRDMFCRQVRAILRASAEGNVRVMFPMVVTLEELEQAKELLEQCKSELKSQGVAYDENIKVGVMIETPAAVLIADR